MVRVNKEILSYVRDQAQLHIMSSSRKEDLGFGILSESEWIALCWIRAVQDVQSKLHQEGYKNSAYLHEIDTAVKSFDVSSVNDDA